MAQQAASIGTELPPMRTMTGLKRKLAVPVARLIVRAAQLVTREQNTFNHYVIGAFQTLAEAVKGQSALVEERLAAVGGAIAAERAEVASELAGLAARADEQHRALKERLDQILTEDLRQAITTSHDDLAGKLTELLGDLRTQRARLEAMRTQVILQERRLSLVLEETRRRADTAPTAATSEIQEHLLDAFYAGFEDHFRGSREDIKERARIYLPIVRKVGAGTPERPVLDLGCGRGEWLELLKESGLHGRGVDRNQGMIAESSQRGLDVAEGDVFTQSAPSIFSSICPSRTS